MPLVILMSINSQFRIYLQGRSYTKGWVKMVSIPFLLLLLSTLHLHLLSLQAILLLFLLKLCFGTKGLAIHAQRCCILPYLIFLLFIFLLLVIYVNSVFLVYVPRCTDFLFQNMHLVPLFLWKWFILMFRALLLLIMYLNIDSIWSLLMILLFLHGFSCLNISLMCLMYLLILSRWLRTNSILKSRPKGLIMVVSLTISFNLFV